MTSYGECIHELREAKEQMKRVEQKLKWIGTAIPQIKTTDDVIVAGLIRKFVAFKYNITEGDFISKRRTERIAWPRQVAMSLCYEMTELSLNEVGELFGNRDHGTVLHACRLVTGRIESYPEIKSDIEELRNCVKKSLIQQEPTA
jgi:chromosomal replication initiation ATPase DnaA